MQPELQEIPLGIYRATVVVAHASVLTEGLNEHATVIFPAESHAEKDGTVTHPDGRLQRLRPAIARQGEIRGEWSILAELEARLGSAPAIANATMASAALFESITPIKLFQDLSNDLAPSS